MTITVNTNPPWHRISPLQGQHGRARGLQPLRQRDTGRDKIIERRRLTAEEILTPLEVEGHLRNIAALSAEPGLRFRVLTEITFNYSPERTLEELDALAVAGGMIQLNVAEENYPHKILTAERLSAIILRPLEGVSFVVKHVVLRARVPLPPTLIAESLVGIAEAGKSRLIRDVAFHTLVDAPASTFKIGAYLDAKVGRYGGITGEQLAEAAEEWRDRSEGY